MVTLETLRVGFPSDTGLDWPPLPQVPPPAISRSGPTITTFISKTIDKNPGKAKGYFYYLIKYKILLVIFSSIMLIFLAEWIAGTYYQKPIYYALLAGAIYLPMVIFSGYLNVVFISKNNFHPQFITEIILQLARLSIIPLLIIYFLAKVSSVEFYLFWIFIALSSCYLLGGIYLFIAAKTQHLFKRTKEQKLSSKEKREILKFIIPVSITSISGVFFGYIDQIMLGHYVESQFLGFYQVAFNLAISASAVLTSTSTAVFPIFARLKGKILERGFKKTRNITLLISTLVAIFIVTLAPVIIQVIYGREYLTSIIYLRIFTLLLISFPLISLYTTYYTSQKRTKVISVLLGMAAILNILLNYIFINIGLSHSMFYAVMGACIATIVSRFAYLGGLILWRRKQKN